MSLAIVETLPFHLLEPHIRSSSVFFFLSSPEPDSPAWEVPPGDPGGRHGGAAVPCFRKAQAHHLVVQGRQGGTHAGRKHAVGELRRCPADRQRLPGNDGLLPLPDQPVQRLQRQAPGSRGGAHRAVWVAHFAGHAHDVGALPTSRQITSMWRRKMHDLNCFVQ